jgi:hypothetical protein
MRPINTEWLVRIDWRGLLPLSALLPLACISRTGGSMTTGLDSWRGLLLLRENSLAVHMFAINDKSLYANFKFKYYMIATPLTDLYNFILLISYCS